MTGLYIVIAFALGYVLCLFRVNPEMTRLSAELLQLRSFLYQKTGYKVAAAPLPAPEVEIAPREANTKPPSVWGEASMKSPDLTHAQRSAQLRDSAEVKAGRKQASY